MKHQFDFTKDYVFENEVIKIEPLAIEHIEELNGVSHDHEIWTYFLEKGIGNQLLEEYCLQAMNNRTLVKEYPFVIFDKRVKKYAGMTRLYDYSHSLEVIKMGHTWLGKEFWGTGLNKHCKILLFEFIFEVLRLKRVGFGVHGENLRSVCALNNIGCEQEGMLRDFLPSLNYPNERIDLLLFSLLEKDWKRSVRDKLALQISK